MEEFVDIYGFSGYEVSNYGKIKNKKTGKILKENPNEKGYMKVNLMKDNRSYTRRVHKLVCEHFNPNPGHKPKVDHEDCNKSNNRADNLRWCTHQENIDFYNEKFRVYKLPKPSKYGTIGDMVKATGKPVRVNGIEFISAGTAATMISIETGKNKRTISKTIRTMISGRRKFGTMYGIYKISSI